MDHSRREKIATALLAVGIVVVMLNQGVVIADVGVVGWLEGDGPDQSEWEVRASLGAIGILTALFVCLLVRGSEGFVVSWKDRRLMRSVREERRRRSEERARR